jgi:purine-binding chemotaxis protein CheW
MSDSRIDWSAMHLRLAAAREGLARGFEPGPAETRRRLRERARQLARKPQQPENESELLTLLEFQLQGRPFAVRGNLVQEVVMELRPTPVPGTPPFLAGIFYLRGQVVSAIDFGQLCGLPPTPEADAIIVLEQGGRMLGLLAERVIGIAGIARDQIDSLPATVQQGRRFFHGISRTGTVLLDGAILFNDDENGFAQAGLPGPAIRGQ